MVEAGMNKGSTSIPSFHECRKHSSRHAEVLIDRKRSETGKAKGTRGTLKGRKKGSSGRSRDKANLSGGTKLLPPDKTEWAATTADLGLTKRQSAEMAALESRAMPRNADVRFRGVFTTKNPKTHQTNRG
jgi:hypothetical protein